MTDLRARACRFIGELNREHPAFEETDFNQPAESLIPAVARATRAAVVPVTVQPLSPDAPVNRRNGRAGETVSQMLDRCLEGTWISVGREYAFPKGVDYNASPDPRLNSCGCAFGEWTWQLNRHPEWRAVAQLYHSTRDERCVTALCRWLEDWLLQCPRPETDLNAQQGSWRTIEIGIRLGGTWPTVLSVVKDISELDDVVWLAFLDSYAQQADFAWQYRKENNWLLMEMNGLLHAGTQLPFHRDAPTWRENAMSEFRRQLDTQFMADGLQRELSPHYHGVCIHNYLMPLRLLEQTGSDVSQQFLDGIQMMLEPLRKLAKPNSMGFSFQDGSGADLGARLRRVPDSLHIPGDDWFIKGEGKPPREACTVLENSGYAVLRSSWDRDAIAVAFDGGPYGDAHQHEDKLSIQLYACGCDLIGEAGTVDYADSPERHYSLSTLAHSTAIIDGKGQARGYRFRKHSRALNELSGIDWDFDSPTPSATATYDDGYGDQRQLKVTHTRTVRLLNARNAEVSDSFSADDNVQHQAEILYHLLVDKAEINNSVLFAQHQNGTKMSIQADAGACRLDCTITIGGSEPDLRGWAESDTHNGTWELVPRPCLTQTVSFTGQATVKTTIQVTPPQG